MCGAELVAVLPPWFGASEISAAVLVILQLTFLKETLGGDVSEVYRGRGWGVGIG